MEKLDRQIPPPEQLRPLRAVEALEQMGASAAREVLEALARGAPEAQITREAKATLARLAKRPTVTP